MSYKAEISGPSIKICSVLFYCCGVYFLLMGAGLIFFPHLLVKGAAGIAVDPVIIGMLRGAGGSVFPYSLLYFMTARKPVKRKWALTIIAVANIAAIVLDFSSVLLDEYKLSYAMIDVPVELISLLAIFIFWRTVTKHENRQYE